MPLTLYHSDGGYNLGRLPLFFLFGLPAAGIFAIVYQLIAWYLPCAGWVTAILLIGYAVGMMMILSAAGTRAHIRNRWVHLGASFLVVGFAYYICWCTFFTLLFDQVNRSAGYSNTGLPSGLIWNPVAMAGYLPKVADIGYRSFGRGSNSTTIAGVFMWIIWFIEAVVVVLVPPFMSLEYINEPYYPASASWGKKRNLAGNFFSPTPPESPAAVLADDQFSWLMRMQPAPTAPDARAAGAFAFQFIEHEDEALSYLIITRAALKLENNKKRSEQKLFVHYIELSPTRRKQIDEYLHEAGARTDVSAPGTAGAGGDDAQHGGSSWDTAAASAVAPPRDSYPPAGCLIGRPEPSFDAAAASARSKPTAEIPAPAEEVDPDAIAARWQAERVARAARPAQPLQSGQPLPPSSPPMSSQTPPQTDPFLPPPPAAPFPPSPSEGNKPHRGGRNPADIGSEWDT